MDNLEDVQRLKALWKSGRDKYQSFFVVLREVQKQVGQDALNDWCVDHLQIGLSVILTMQKVLLRADAAKAQKDFGYAASRLDSELEAKLDVANDQPADAQEAREATLLARIAELEARLAAASEAPQPVMNGHRGPPKRDRREYMREFMRRKRAAATR
jgi:hypothetical protein